MRTIGSRLTLLYLCIVGGGVLAIYFAGQILLAQQIRKNLDGMLGDGFKQLRSRLTTDPVRSNLDLSVLMPGQDAAMPVYVEVKDLWEEASYRAAKMAGQMGYSNSAPRYYDSIWANGEKVRVIEGASESLLLRIATPLSPLDRATARYSRVGLSAVGVVIALSLVAGYILSQAALRPIRTIRETAARMRSDNLGQRIPVGNVRDEISDLAHLLNQTFDRLEASFEQVNKFSADVSHELKTPLSLVRLNVEQVLEDPFLPPTSRHALADAIEEIHKLSALIEKMLFLSRAQAGEIALDFSLHDSQEFLEDFLHDSAPLAESKRVTFELEEGRSQKVFIDGGRIRQVLFNLLGNALHATPPGGKITLRSIPGHSVWGIVVDDDGVGLPPAECELIFERFVRIQRAGSELTHNGAGLGLAICRSIVELHHGRIFATPRDPRGLRVTVEIPVSHQ